ncbi:MAG TPA: SpoIIE family protein phosphatase [Thermoanaerobaculia bacterium]|jgi:serine phosphatase RsbU (regulator of sigma subunit)|nr:SpoIIE family protein phosphatase [Thermoanaerobaculia bacterium]
MKIRTQLAVAFLLLAVVPLTGIVLYSYFSSLQAIRQETEAQARTMEARMTSLKGELGRGFERIGDVPASELMTAARSHQEGRPDPLFDRMVLGFGEAAPLLRSLEFVPVPPSPLPSAPPAPPAPGYHAETPHLVEKVIIDVPGILRQARRAAELAPETDPHALAAIDAAVEALAEGEEAPPVPAEPPEAGLPAPAPPAPAIPSPPVDVEKIRKEVAKQMAESRKARADANAAERERQRIARERARVEKLMIGRRLEMPVWEQGKVVGTVKAQIRGDELLRRVLTRTPRNQGEIPFAVDAEGKLHTVDEVDRRKLEGLQSDFVLQVRTGTGARAFGYWAVATSKDSESGLVLGIARPAPLQVVRKAAARNFAYGLGMIGLALLGILPLSTRMTRNLKMVTEGADRIAQGDLDARVPVRSRNEFGRLALAFNRMAEDLKTHQELLLEEERLRREREMEQALLQTEYDRKTRELEEARRFQLSLLPKSLPDHPGFEIAVSMRTATEVGGDYYDFHLGEEGALTVAVGDATGHGAAAGTMVTVVKSLFSADAGSSRPREFLDQAAQAVKRMELGRMAMGLCLARLAGSALTLSSAGMPPVFIRRQASGEAEEIALQGMPLGGLASEYQERSLEVEPGDTILLMTDGLPELQNGDGDPLGYPRVRSLFESLGAKPPEEIIAGLGAAADSWSGGQPPKDDITFVVLRGRSTRPSA